MAGSGRCRERSELGTGDTDRETDRRSDASYLRAKPIGETCARGREGLKETPACDVDRLVKTGGNCACCVVFSGRDAP